MCQVCVRGRADLFQALGFLDSRPGQTLSWYYLPMLWEGELRGTAEIIPFNTEPGKAHEPGELGMRKSIGESP